MDELGIVLRLEKATTDYASAIGKSAKDLTAFERQQAVMNNVLQQASEKYGDIDVKINRVNAVAAKFKDIADGIMKELIPEFEKFSDLIEGALVKVDVFIEQQLPGIIRQVKKLAGLFLGLQIAKGVWNFVSLFKKGGTLRNAFAKDGWLRKAFGKKGWIGKGLSRLTKGLKNIGKKLGGKDGLFSKAWKGIKSGSKGIWQGIKKGAGKVGGAIKKGASY